MSELDRVLSEAQETHRQMMQASKTAGDRAVRDIVRLRTRFATLIAEMMGSIKADARLQATPHVAQEFEAKFFDMRQALAQHQGKWRSTNIEADSAGYRRATEEVGRKLDDFYSWANATLAKL
jgi:lysophospholipase L1-like esterase